MDVMIRSVCFDVLVIQNLLKPVESTPVIGYASFCACFAFVVFIAFLCESLDRLDVAGLLANPVMPGS